MNRKTPALILACLLSLTIAATAVAPQPTTVPAIKPPDLTKLTPCPVVRVIDGDTIVVNLTGKVVTVRLIGVDTPETKHPSKPVQYYGKEASRFTTNLLKGEKVYLDSDTAQIRFDRYKRSLAYVYRAPGGLFVNAEIVRQGYGHAYVKFPFKHLAKRSGNLNASQGRRRRGCGPTDRQAPRSQRRPRSRLLSRQLSRPS